jgi:hypothetical protein
MTGINIVISGLRRVVGGWRIKLPPTRSETFVRWASDRVRAYSRRVEGIAEVLCAVARERSATKPAQLALSAASLVARRPTNLRYPAGQTECRRALPPRLRRSPSDALVVPDVFAIGPCSRPVREAGPATIASAHPPVLRRRRSGSSFPPYPHVHPAQAREEAWTPQCGGGPATINRIKTVRDLAVSHQNEVRRRP